MKKKLRTWHWKASMTMNRLLYWHHTRHHRWASKRARKALTALRAEEAIAAKLQQKVSQ